MSLFRHILIAALVFFLTGCASSRTLSSERACSDQNELLHDKRFVVVFKDGRRLLGKGLTLEPGIAVFEQLNRKSDQRIPIEEIDELIVREGLRVGTAVGTVIAAGGVVSLLLAESGETMAEAIGFGYLGMVGLGIGGVVTLISEFHKPRQVYVLEGCQDTESAGWYENY